VSLENNDPVYLNVYLSVSFLPVAPPPPPSLASLSPVICCSRALGPSTFISQRIRRILIGISSESECIRVQCFRNSRKVMLAATPRITPYDSNRDGSSTPVHEPQSKSYVYVCHKCYFIYLFGELKIFRRRTPLRFALFTHGTLTHCEPKM
jgi:hypothetical protein